MHKTPETRTFHPYIGVTVKLDAERIEATDDKTGQIFFRMDRFIWLTPDDMMNRKFWRECMRGHRAGTVQIEANNRTQAASIAIRAGYVVADCNMIG